MRIFTLYFGCSVAGRAEVSDKEWREFRDQVISPELPNGYTVLDGQGALDERPLARDHRRGDQNSRCRSRSPIGMLPLARSTRSEAIGSIVIINTWSA